MNTEWVLVCCVLAAMETFFAMWQFKTAGASIKIKLALMWAFCHWILRLVLGCALIMGVV